jgi:hypothetical protein
MTFDKAPESLIQRRDAAFPAAAEAPSCIATSCLPTGSEQLTGNNRFLSSWPMDRARLREARIEHPLTPY